MKLAFCVLLLAWSVQPVWAEDDLRAVLKELSAQVKELKSQVRASNARVDQLEDELARMRANPQQAAAPAIAATTAAPAATSGGNFAADAAAKADSKPAVTVGDVKGTFKIPGTATSLGVGGFVKVDALLANVSMGRERMGDQQLIYSQIPVGSIHGEHSQTTFHAKESRVWLRSFTPTSWGDVNTYVEVDFFGDAATYTYTPRLRHAYGSIGNLLAGQTWTTFLNTAVLPDHLDPGGSAGSVSVWRQPLLRWTQPFSVAGTPLEIQAAVESPRSRLRGGAVADADAFVAPNADRYPDLVARLNYNPDWGNLSLAALGRQIRNTDPLTDREEGEWGGAVSLAGKISTIGMDNVRFMLNYGNALGRYAAINSFEDAALSSGGDIQLVNTYSGLFSYQHFWSQTWRSTATYGFAQADQPPFVDANLTHQVQSVHANLLWSPVAQATFGMEYVYANRAAVDGRDGDLHRVEFSARYNF
ncbi:MAG: porin [Methylococcaceae bacterium]|nr:MAG: porin [Methylococcaceae bacterium]